MRDYSWRRTVFLALLGTGVFFTIAALLALLTWFMLGAWRPFLTEIALLAALTTMPAAYLLWGRYVVHRL